MISFTALTVAVSFSRGVYPPLVTLATTVLLATALGVRLRNLAKAAMAISLFVLAVTLPMALYQTLLNRSSPSDPIALLWSIAPLLLRCIAATSVLVLMAQSLGLTGLITGLRGLRVPPRALFALTLFLRYVPIMLRDATRLLSAREARIIASSNAKRDKEFMVHALDGRWQPADQGLREGLQAPNGLEGQGAGPRLRPHARGQGGLTGLHLRGALDRAGLLAGVDVI